MIDLDHDRHFTSASCGGEVCSVCGTPAKHKLGEEIWNDDPNPYRHNLTAYVCCEHFRMIVGSCGAAFMIDPIMEAR